MRFSSGPISSSSVMKGCFVVSLRSRRQAFTPHVLVCLDAEIPMGGNSPRFFVSSPSSVKSSKPPFHLLSRRRFSSRHSLSWRKQKISQIREDIRK
jgi:hypothetical protein